MVIRSKSSKGFFDSPVRSFELQNVESVLLRATPSVKVSADIRLPSDVLSCDMFKDFRDPVR